MSEDKILDYPKWTSTGNLLPRLGSQSYPTEQIQSQMSKKLSRTVDRFL